LKVVWGFRGRFKGDGREIYTSVPSRIIRLIPPCAFRRRYAELLSLELLLSSLEAELSSLELLELSLALELSSLELLSDEELSSLESSALTLSFPSRRGRALTRGFEVGVFAGGESSFDLRHRPCVVGAIPRRYSNWALQRFVFERHPKRIHR
jgi:hypothetical protein